MAGNVDWVAAQGVGRCADVHWDSFCFRGVWLFNAKYVCGAVGSIARGEYVIGLTAHCEVRYGGFVDV
jgi:hypothetical protein